MTHRERASKLAKDMVYAYEVCATMKDLDGAVHAWTVLAEKAITAAVEEEREACAKIADGMIGARRREIAEAIRARCTSSASACNTSEGTK